MWTRRTPCPNSCMRPRLCRRAGSSARSGRGSGPSIPSRAAASAFAGRPTRSGACSDCGRSGRSGIERAAILGYWEDGADLITMAMNGWADPEPAWWLNLQANPDATVDLLDGPRSVRARAAGADERPPPVGTPGRVRQGSRCLRRAPVPRDRRRHPVAPTRGGGMSADRKAAAAIGVLYIIGTAAFVLSAVVTAGALATNVSLDEVAAQRDQLAVGTLLVLVAGFALAMVPVVFWPVGRRYDEMLAMGYVVFRGAIETICTSASRWGGSCCSRSAPSRLPDRSPVWSTRRSLSRPISCSPSRLRLVRCCSICSSTGHGSSRAGCRRGASSAPRSTSWRRSRACSARRSSSSWDRSPCRRWSSQCG